MSRLTTESRSTDAMALASSLFRRDRCRYEGLVHERLNVQGSVGILEGDLIHRPFHSLVQSVAAVLPQQDTNRQSAVSDACRRSGSP